ncbi:MAG: transglycosylase domain-containing protein, partial [Rectinema sp.]|nr:transglycosylase domain-containing protein [Rectinema sp.]
MNSNKARAPTFRSRLLTLLRAVIIAILALHLAYIGITSILLGVYKFANPPGTVLMLYRRLSSGWKIQKPIPLTLREIPLTVRRMLISVEDGKFYEHNGFDMEAIRRAQELNRRLGRPMYGGSTISMQVARTLFLVPEKS